MRRLFFNRRKFLAAGFFSSASYYLCQPNNGRLLEYLITNWRRKANWMCPFHMLRTEVCPSCIVVVQVLVGYQFY